MGIYEPGFNPQIMFELRKSIATLFLRRSPALYRLKNLITEISFLNVSRLCFGDRSISDGYSFHLLENYFCSPFGNLKLQASTPLYLDS